ncbi:MAG: ShlB/FhaC/HecB family hemolysin secretion/activation protein [Pseudomonadales bacterium]|nr:ShlB/FhaC/HecB family hemolysin secretion/activation protein [Pseudomonadales bacterium]
MSLMKLAPESVRLRRIAKAHAAGEFSLSDYRLARREVITNFKASVPDDDDTQPRWKGEVLENTDDTTQGTPPTRSAVGWMMLVLILLTALAAAQVFALEIPAMADRDPNPATSPRLPVERIVLGEVPQLPGLSIESVQAVADAALADVRARNQPGPHGFTPAELEEIGRLLNALGAHQPDQRFSAQDTRDLTELVKDQKRRRGVSVVELEAVAGAVQAHYREAGYFLAAAYVPAQSVDEGSVRIDVLAGTLGEVVVRGSHPRLAGRFDDLLHQPITAEAVNTRIYALNQAPGILAQASFEPGAAVGETRLQLEVVEQTTFNGSLGFDNHGDGDTGETRLSLNGSWANPLNRGDLLNAGLIAAFHPANQVFGYLGYETPVGGRAQARVRLASNDFSTSGLDATDGEGLLFDASVERYLFRSRTRALSVEAGAGLHRLEWSTDNGDLDQQVRFLSAALKGHRVWDALLIEGRARLHAEAGSIDEETFAGQDDQYWRVGVDLFAWRPLDVQWLPGRQKISASFTGRLTDSQLPSSRRLGVAGAEGARGYQRDLFVADSGGLLRVDLRTPVALGEILFFSDLTYGRTHNNIDDTWARLVDIGVAWEAEFGEGFVSRLSGAVPIHTDGSDGLDDDGVRIFWSLQYAR